MGKELQAALANIPKQLREPLIGEYVGCLEAWRLRHWETVGLKAGKLCEITYSILSGYVAGKFPSKPSKPANMLAACTALEQASAASFSRSVRIQIPRVLIAVYELRNNRAIGHVGGDIDPNFMDAEFFQRSVKWIVAELVRIFHGATIGDAQRVVENISERSMPAIWSDGDKIRVLRPDLPYADKTLLVAYFIGKAEDYRVLCRAVEYSSASAYKKNVLAKLHEKKLIDFELASGLVTLLPPGLWEAERLANA
ncbi:MAG TPA: hypothetical protein VGD66_12775 [Allosphingosinicella sp.]